MKNWFKENSSHLIVIAIFFALVFFYFSPVWQGKGLSQHDVVQAMGSQKELFDYRAKDGTAPQWTNSMFGGMPTFQIWYEHANNIGTYINRAITAVFPSPADVVLIFLLGAYFMLSVFRVRPWLAAVGAIAIAFSSYNFIYIEAGHLNRAYAIAYLAPIIGAIVLSYRGNRVWGTLLLALFLALEIRTNHIQMTYYLLIAMLVYVGYELYYAIRDKKLNQFLKATAFQSGAVIIAIAVNASVLFPTYEYSKLTTRGKANIVKVEEGAKSSGLDKDYAYAWSQGIGENITMLIPNAYGGRSQGVLTEKSNVAKFFTSVGAPQNQAVQYAQSIPTYWGDKTFTSGPWYFGAGVMALFILALFVVRDRVKYWVVSAIVLTMLLALGSNFSILSDLFFDYAPLYNKFRAPESILIIPSILIPLLAVLGVNDLITRKNEIPNLDKKVLYSFGAVAAICLLVALMPNFLDLRGANHQDFISTLSQQFGDANMANQLADALVKDRADIASADAWRSFFIVAIIFVLVWTYLKQKISSTVLVVVLGVVTLVDLWSVDKRYLNDSVFVTKSQAQPVIPMREVDQLIQMDKDPSYRVLDLTSSVFSDAKASYYHKSLGGYHAAKLMRFQEILDNQFNGAINEDVLDMFNVRYVITQNPQNGSEGIQRRSTAAGNAWFVDKVTFVKDNAQEMQAISSFDPTKEAFVHDEFKGKLQPAKLGGKNNASIKLTSYHPDKMEYEYSSPNDAFAVFSEVFYDKGWKAYVDGEEVPIIRADYILRALQLPGGNHKVEFVFDPETMKVSNIISLIGSLVLVLGFVVVIGWSFKKKNVKTT
ncbi:YfhO family protein [Sphingobacterium rhinopitheci]|uniref:YfhO family protein n=1 Tax=Sphingobacterium rhinopitheci TaxID=2781960 RepID=UPI001F5206D4|nr:YfhO family protein [Sphingobacterium rhinopitheci]MCI0921487.1 YfhO family protein [Sphingobacterium rhinopitheci]